MENLLSKRGKVVIEFYPPTLLIIIIIIRLTSRFNHHQANTHPPQPTFHPRTRTPHSVCTPHVPHTTPRQSLCFFLFHVFFSIFLYLDEYAFPEFRLKPKRNKSKNLVQNKTNP